MAPPSHYRAELSHHLSPAVASSNLMRPWPAGTSPRCRQRVSMMRCDLVKAWQGTDASGSLLHPRMPSTMTRRDPLCLVRNGCLAFQRSPIF
jgi:hypothetical protein